MPLTRDGSCPAVGAGLRKRICSVACSQPPFPPEFPGHLLDPSHWKGERVEMSSAPSFPGAGDTGVGAGRGRGRR